ncbi:MAG TPA: DUF4132 domain-containing protein [Polyangiaceae bacterium]|jgi:hypothetical protein
MPDLPDVLARPPWPPARRRNVLALAVPAREPRLVWESGQEHAWAHPGGGADRKLELREREEILTKLETKDIVRIDAATNLEKSDLLRAMQTCEPRFLEHYGIVRAALAKFGLEVLDVIFEVAKRAPSCALEAFLRVDSVEVAARIEDEEMLARWAGAHAETAALAFLPSALGSESAERKRAMRFLARLRREGHETAIRAAAASYGGAASAEIDALFAPEPLPSRAPSLPSFVDLASLPMPKIRADAIGDEARERLVQLLSLLPLGAARDAIATVRAVCEPESLAALGGTLADRWALAGAETKHKWAILAAGALGDDMVARKLADWTTLWANEGSHARSRLALDALSLIATASTIHAVPPSADPALGFRAVPPSADPATVALMHIDRIARTMKGALRANANATLELIAKERNLTHDELGDRLVPTLGLDPSGSTWLDFGTRRFRVSFDEALLPELFDESGERLARLPRPTKSDDAERASRAVATFKGLQSDAKKIAPDQVRRLERAMCTQRAWSAADFRGFFLEHPLMLHLARRLVWLGESGATFRVTEDGGFAGEDDREVPLGEERVRIAHPIALGARAATWSALLDDYRIVQPFPQLAREVFALDEKTAARSSLDRFEGRAVAGERFYSLRHRGWGFHDYAIGKPIRGGFLAMLETEPGLDFLASRPPDQTLCELSLRRGSGGPATFGELDPIDASELLRDVELL